MKRVTQKRVNVRKKTVSRTKKRGQYTQLPKSLNQLSRGYKSLVRELSKR